MRRNPVGTSRVSIRPRETPIEEEENADSDDDLYADTYGQHGNQRSNKSSTALMMCTQIPCTDVFVYKKNGRPLEFICRTSMWCAIEQGAIIVKKSTHTYKR